MGCIEEVIVKVAVIISPLEEGELIEPEVKPSLKTVCRVCSVGISVRSGEECSAVVISHLKIGRVCIGRQIIYEGFSITKGLQMSRWGEWLSVIRVDFLLWIPLKVM